MRILLFINRIGWNRYQIPMKQRELINYGILLLCIIAILSYFFMTGDKNTRQQDSLLQHQLDSVKSLVVKQKNDSLNLSRLLDSISAQNDALKSVIKLNDSLQQARIQRLRKQFKTVECPDFKHFMLKSRCDSVTESLQNNIRDLQHQLKKIQADHSMAVLFLLQCSLSYYSYDDTQKQQIITMISAVSGLIDTTASVESIKNRIYYANADKHTYKGVMWAEQLASCPAAPSALLLTIYGFDPITAAAQHYRQFLSLLFARLPAHLMLCSSDVKNIFGESTKDRLDKTIHCLKTRLDIK